MLGSDSPQKVLRLVRGSNIQHPRSLEQKAKLKGHPEAGQG